MSLREFLRPFGITGAPDAKRIGRSYFLVKETGLLKHGPTYTGECIAHQRQNEIIPSATYLQKIGKQARKHVTVTPDGEWLFICGRDLFGKNITAHNKPTKGERVVVLNEHKECLGYGDMEKEPDNEGVVLRRLFDIGDLLRRERRKRTR